MKPSTSATAQTSLLLSLPPLTSPPRISSVLHHHNSVPKKKKKEGNINNPTEYFLNIYIHTHTYSVYIHSVWYGSTSVEEPSFPTDFLIWVSAISWFLSMKGFWEEFFCVFFFCFSDGQISQEKRKRRLVERERERERESIRWQNGRERERRQPRARTEINWQRTEDYKRGKNRRKIWRKFQNL